jgi:hypothetical protein
VGAALAAQAIAANRVDRTALDAQGAASGQGFSHLAVCCLQDAPEGGPGYAHALRRLLLVEPLAVGQADGLELVEGELNLLELEARNAGGLEERDRGARANAAAGVRARHEYCQSLIMSICS